MKSLKLINLIGQILKIYVFFLILYNKLLTKEKLYLTCTIIAINTLDI